MGGGLGPPTDAHRHATSLPSASPHIPIPMAPHPTHAPMHRMSYVESETAKYDAEAMRYLSYALYPLILGYAVYSLVYRTHKSWYSWVLNSLVGAVYTFGFILMCPQLYLNYKLKSVAHLPWCGAGAPGDFESPLEGDERVALWKRGDVCLTRPLPATAHGPGFSSCAGGPVPVAGACTTFPPNTPLATCRRQMSYKFLNTIIDDLFAFVIKMPLLHRLSGEARDAWPPEPSGGPAAHRSPAADPAGRHGGPRSRYRRATPQPFRAAAGFVGLGNHAKLLRPAPSTQCSGTTSCSWCTCISAGSTGWTRPGPTSLGATGGWGTPSETS